MRTKILLFVSLLMMIALNVNSSKQEVETTLREIIIKTKAPNNGGRLSVPKLGGTTQAAPTAYIMDNTVTVNFSSSVSNASVMITNAETGEVVHYEVFSSSVATTLYIYLNDCDPGYYFIDISSKAGESSGEFTLD